MASPFSFSIAAKQSCTIAQKTEIPQTSLMVSSAPNQMRDTLKKISISNDRIARHQSKVNRNAKMSSKDRLAFPEEGSEGKKGSYSNPFFSNRRAFPLTAGRAAAHLEETLGSIDAWDYILKESEPSLKEKVLRFFGKSAQDYAGAEDLSSEARKLLFSYKKMFDQLAERNRGNNAVEMAREDADNKKSVTRMNEKNMQVTDMRFAMPEDISEDEKNSGIAVAEFIESVNNMMEEAKRSKRKKKIGILSKDHVAIINKLMQTVIPDFSASGYELWIDGTGAHHIEVRHGKNGEADHTMASKEAKTLIPWAAQNADSGEFIRNENGTIKKSDRYFNSDGSRAPEIKFKKITHQGVIFISECVPDSLKKRIWITSAYANKNGSKGQLLNLNPKDSSNLTPEASFDGNATNDRIAQEQQKVNRNDKISSKDRLALPEEGSEGEKGALLQSLSFLQPPHMAFMCHDRAQHAKAEIAKYGIDPADEIAEAEQAADKRDRCDRPSCPGGMTAAKFELLPQIFPRGYRAGKRRAEHGDQQQGSKEPPRGRMELPRQRKHGQLVGNRFGHEHQRAQNRARNSEQNK